MSFLLGAVFSDTSLTNANINCGFTIGSVAYLETLLNILQMVDGAVASPKNTTLFPTRGCSLCRLAKVERRRSQRNSVLREDSNLQTRSFFLDSEEYLHPTQELRWNPVAKFLCGQELL